MRRSIPPACLAVLLVAFAPLLLAQEKPAEDPRLASLFDRLDANGDGKLVPDEMPERQRGRFGRMDANGDGAVSREEFAASRGGRGTTDRKRARLAEPTHANVRYGDHERNVLDLWIAESENPTPFVVYYHGGGFRAGDKRSLSPELLAGLLGKGISVAAANYRLSDTAPFPAAMHDSARALQFLRSRAAEYGLDPARAGATGGSAGAGISLWLAFHDDLADPESEDPVLRQSSRLSVAVVTSGQTSYDPRFVGKLFDTDQVHPALIAFFGMSAPEDVAKEEFHAAFREASPIEHATADDPPVYLYYSQPNDPLPKGSSGGKHIHHPAFGFALQKKLAPLGVPCVVRLRKDFAAGRSPTAEWIDFFAMELLPPRKR